MTQEEAKKILQNIYFEVPEIKEALQIAVEALSQLSFPSNLDEAAEKEIDRFCSDMLNVDIIWAGMPLTKRFGLQMAKFGAEWMAGQGVTLKGHVCKDEYATEPPFYYVETENSDDLPLVGDKVVVQIRKK